MVIDVELSADCSRCFALCCVAPAFARSSEFAIDKPAGVPCPNLRTDHLCGIHDRLGASGFSGCSTYDCYGAGQHLAQGTFGGVDGRDEPSTAAAMYAALPVMRALHELLWLIAEARGLPSSAPIRAGLDTAYDDTLATSNGTAAELLALDVAAHRDRLNPLLLDASARARARYGRPRDLRGARLTGADLRGADLSHARTADALFLHQQQLDGARGDAATTIPEGRRRPEHWRAHPSGCNAAP